MDIVVNGNFGSEIAAKHGEKLRRLVVVFRFGGTGNGGGGCGAGLREPRVELRRRDVLRWLDRHWRRGWHHWLCR